MNDYPRPWEKRYSVRQSCLGKIIVQMSQRVPDDGVGDWCWTPYRDANAQELKNVMILIAKGEVK